MASPIPIPPQPSPAADREEHSSININRSPMWGIGFDWSNLAEDLKVEILCRLGEKPLIRLKCVSKYWYFLISNICAPQLSTFCGLLYTRRNAKTNEANFQFCAYNNNNYDDKLYCKFPNMPEFMDNFKSDPRVFQDCCNGLLLLVRFPEYYVYNPTTYECIRIPDNPNSNPKLHASSALAFDPCTDNSFMIVVSKQVGSPRNSSMELDLFSSDDSGGNWTSYNLPLDPVLNGFYLLDRFVYLNETLYTLSMAKQLLSIHLKKTVTSSGVVNNNNNIMIYARTTELPANYKFDNHGTFGVLGGSLAYSVTDLSQMLIWVLKADGVSWALRHRICLDELVSHPHALPVVDNRRLIDVYAFHPDSEQIFVGTPRQIQMYNLKTKELKKFEQLIGHIVHRGDCKVFPYSRCPLILNNVIKKVR